LKSQSTLVNPTNKAAGGPASSREAAPRTMSFPPWDSYDFQYVPKDPLGPPELRYNLKWTTGGLGLGDSPRQLIYRDPPETTVVTWCLYHADFDGAGVPKKGSMAQVLFLSGRVQQIPVDQLKAWSGTDGPWTVNPKP